MATPHDDRSPFAQERWPECRNDGAGSLPAHSVAQVTQSIRLDTHRTVLLVKEGQSNSPQATVVIGPFAIGQGAYGICTNDFPAWARVDGSPAVGTTMGLASGGSQLVAGQTGYIVLGDVHDGIARVMKVACP